MLQNIRSYLVLYPITIKWAMFVREKIELVSISQRPRLSSIKFLEISLYLQRLSNNKQFRKKLLGVAK